MDLLFAYDWYTAADNLANQFGAEEGNEYRMGAEDYFPDLIIPEQTKEDAKATTENKEPAGEPVDDTQVASVELDAKAETSDGTNAEQSEAEDTEAEEPKEPAVAEDTDSPKSTDEDANEDETAVTVAEPPKEPTASATAEPESDSGGAFSSVLLVGAGLAVALVALFGLTFLVLRPK
jgi:hypothetical protein